MFDTVWIQFNTGYQIVGGYQAGLVS